MCEKKTFWISVSPSLCGLVAKQSETVTHVTFVGTGIDFYRFQSHTSSTSYCLQVRSYSL